MQTADKRTSDGIAPTTAVEQVRARIAYGLLLIVAVTIVLSFAAAAGHWASPADIGLFAVPIVLAEITLLEAVTTFYYR